LTIHELLRFTAEAGASDLHIAAGAHPMVRVNGRMKKTKFTYSKSGRSRNPCFRSYE